FAAFLALLIPPLVEEVTLLVASLPDVDQVQGWLARLRSALQTLPPPAQELLRSGIEQVTTNVRSNAALYLQAAGQIPLGTLLGLFGTLGFVIGFLGIPTWLVSVLTDQRAGVRALNRALPAAVQPDFWAVVRILDRTFSAFVRGQLLFGVITGCFIYAGFAI